MTNMIKTLVISALFCAPQMGYAMSKFKIVDGALGLAGYAAFSFATEWHKKQKMLENSTSLWDSSCNAHLPKTTDDIKTICKQLGMEHYSPMLHVAKKTEEFGPFQIPLSHHMVATTELQSDDSKNILINFREDYFTLPDEQKKAALVPELLRIKNREDEKNMAAAIILPLAITKTATYAAGQSVVAALNKVYSIRSIRRNKYASLGVQGLKTIADAFSKSYFIPWASTMMIAEGTNYENTQQGGSTTYFVGPSMQLWHGCQLKAVAAYNRYRAKEMDMQATNVIGKDAMVAYLSESQYETKITYADPLCSPAPSFKERLENIVANTK